MDVTLPSITILRETWVLVCAVSSRPYAEQDWTPIPTSGLGLLDAVGAADVAETSYVLHCPPFQSARAAAGAAHRPACEAHAPVPSWPSSPPTAITAASPTWRTAPPWAWKPRLHHHRPTPAPIHWTPIPYMEGAARGRDATRRCGSSSQRPVPSWPSSPPTAITASSPTGRGKPSGGRPSAPRRDRERHPRPQVRRGVEPSPLGPLPRAWLAVQVIAHNLVWYVGMRQTDPTWVEENRGPAWSSHPILIEPEQLPGPIAPASCKEGPTRKGRRSHRRYRWKENRDS